MINVDGGKVVGWRWQRCLVVVLVVCSLVSAFLIHPRPVLAATLYYVSTSGSDSNPGTSDRPWRTIQKAANTMVAGDTVTVRAGDYPERVQVSRSGSSGSQITYQAEGTVTMRGFTVRGNYVTIRGFDISNTPNAWADGQGIFVQANYCIIENNYVHYATRGGIFVYAEPWEWSSRTGNVVRNNRLGRNALVGIEVHGRNHVIEGNEIWGTIQHHPSWPSPPYSDADGMRFFGSGHVFRRNYIHDINFSDPENDDPHIDCFQTWGGEYQEAGRDIVFERNWCEVLESQTAYESGTAFMLAGSRGLIIRSNILQAAKHINTGGGGNSYLTVVNNTMTSDLSFPTSNYPQGIALENCPNSTVRNNILYNLPGEVYKVTGTSTTGLAMGNNLAYRSDGKALVGSPYPGDLWGVVPGFVNAGAANYHLQTTSAAVDSGYNVGTLVPVDYDGIARPQGSAFDRGACECTGSNPPATPVPTPVPTPVSPVQHIFDNAGSGFSTSAAQDAWQRYDEAGGEHYGGSHA
ncbi:MAG TPA: right-handed parallel beta-helix repeat-containing protein, partial [Anaerolineae bacterium]|nr:right-handed parallel beta-helix repeat-containing protein [Anaerolineae bacterium]